LSRKGAKLARVFALSKPFNVNLTFASKDHILNSAPERGFTLAGASHTCSKLEKKKLDRTNVKQSCSLFFVLSDEEKSFIKKPLTGNVFKLFFSYLIKKAPKS
jgi:hypothetical protein